MRLYRLEFFEDEDGDQPVRRWLREELTRTQRLVVGTAMREILEEVEDAAASDAALGKSPYLRERGGWTLLAERGSS